MSAKDRRGEHFRGPALKSLLADKPQIFEQALAEHVAGKSLYRLAKELMISRDALHWRFADLGHKHFQALVERRRNRHRARALLRSSRLRAQEAAEMRKDAATKAMRLETKRQVAEMDARRARLLANT